jgi:hypothetical protein
MKPLMAVIALSLMLVACGGGTRTSSVEENAWTACTLFVEKQYGLSFLDAEDYRESGVLHLSGEQFLVRVWYADQGNQYECMVERRSNGDFLLLSLDVY